MLHNSFKITELVNNSPARIQPRQLGSKAEFFTNVTKWSHRVPSTGIQTLDYLFNYPLAELLVSKDWTHASLDPQPLAEDLAYDGTPW